MHRRRRRRARTTVEAPEHLKALPAAETETAAAAAASFAGASTAASHSTHISSGENTLAVALTRTRTHTHAQWWLICNRTHSLPYLSIFYRALFATRKAADGAQHDKCERCDAVVRFYILPNLLHLTTEHQLLISINDSPNISGKTEYTVCLGGKGTRKSGGGGFPRGYLFI